MNWLEILTEANPPETDLSLEGSLGPQRFGPALKSARLGFGWSEKYKAMIRISIIDPETFCVVMTPPNVIPTKNKGAREYVCWWDDPKGLDLSPAIAANANPKETVFLRVNNEGEEI